MLGDDIKKLGFGLMRLPKIGQDEDIEQTKQMVDIFMSKGFTYFDTVDNLYRYADRRENRLK